MAIVTFGATARANNSVAFHNTSAVNLAPGFLHGGSIGPNAYKYFSFNYFDSLFRGNNFRQNELYSINANGKAYLDDVAELAAMLASGQLVAYTATQVASSGAFTLGSALASSSLGDGSVLFS